MYAYIYTCISFSILLSLFPRSSRSHGKIESKMGGPKLQLIKITYDSLRNVRPYKIDPHLPTSWRNLQSTLLTSMSFKLGKGISSLSTLSSSKNQKLKVRTCLRRNGNWTGHIRWLRSSCWCKNTLSSFWIEPNFQVKRLCSATLSIYISIDTTQKAKHWAEFTRIQIDARCLYYSIISVFGIQRRLTRFTLICNSLSFIVLGILASLTSYKLSLYL